MAAVNSLRTHLVEELNDLRDAEHQLIDMLPKLARFATAKPLRTAFQKHLTETRAQLVRLNAALRDLGEKPASKTCKGMKGLLAEGDTVINKTPEGALRDAVMITAAQKVEHYEMASYGTARTYARVLGESGVARLLEQTLKEEKAADLTLTKIAEGTVNEDAAEEWQAEQSTLEAATEWVGGTARAASRGMTRRLNRAARASGLVAGRSTRRKARGGTRSARTRRAAAR